MSAKCDCPRASDDGDVNLEEHTVECARRKDWEETKRTAFMIERHRVMCMMHGEPFRETWPLGFPLFAVKAFQLVMGLPGIWDEALRLARPSSCTREKPCASCVSAQAGDKLESGLAPLCLMSSVTDPAHYNLGIKSVEAVLDVKPVCCRVSPKALVGLYEEARIGTMKRCRSCNRKRIGTPFSSTNLGRIEHVCFECLSTASSSPPSVH